MVCYQIAQKFHTFVGSYWIWCYFSLLIYLLLLHTLSLRPCAEFVYFKICTAHYYAATGETGTLLQRTKHVCPELKSTCMLPVDCCLRLKMHKAEVQTTRDTSNTLFCHYEANACMCNCIKLLSTTLGIFRNRQHGVRIAGQHLSLLVKWDVPPPAHVLVCKIIRKIVKRKDSQCTQALLYGFRIHLLLRRQCPIPPF